MARKKYKTKGIGSPLFPNLRYVEDRSGRKLSKRDALIVSAEKNEAEAQPSQESKRIIEETPKSILRKKIMFFIVGLLVVSVAFLPTL